MDYTKYNFFLLQIQNPYIKKPPYKFGTVTYTNANSVFLKHLPEMHRYMSPHNKSKVTDGIKAIKSG